MKGLWKMKNKKLIKEIFKRLEGNFPCLSSPKYAQTGSEIAADSLRETLYNIGLDGLYVFRVGLDDLGLWTAYFKVVDVKDEEIEEMWDERRSDFFIEGYGERILKNDWRFFEAGTTEKEIDRWFNAAHSKGIYWLRCERKRG